MRLIKFSLAAVASMSIFGALNASDSLIEALKNGKPTVELRGSYHYGDTDIGSATNPPGGRGIANLGVVLGYETGAFYGFSLGATMQSNFSPWASDKQKTRYANDLYGPGAVLSELFLKYSISKTDIKVGRQFINTPLISGSRGRLVYQAFQGVTINSADIANTKLFAAYIDKYQGRTTYSVDTSFDAKDSDAPKFTNRINLIRGNSQRAAGVSAMAARGEFDGLYSFMVQNTSVPNLKLTAQYVNLMDFKSGDTAASKSDDVHMFHAEANYEIPLENFKLTLDLGLKASRTSKNLDDKNVEGEYYLGRIGFADLAGFTGAFAYSTTSSSDAVAAGVGNGPFTFTATPYFGPLPSLAKDTDAYSFDLKYDFAKMGIKGLKLWTAYVEHKQNDISIGTSAKTEDVEYKTGYVGFDYNAPTIKGLRFHLGYERQHIDYGVSKDNEQDMMRFRVFYKIL